MIDSVKRDIINVLKGGYRALKNKEVAELRDLSNHTIHNASIFRDKDSVSIAIIIFSLSKILEKNQYRQGNEWKGFYKGCLSFLDTARSSLDKDNFENYSNTMSEFFKFISIFDRKMNLFIDNVLDNAKIKKGCRVYEHGISIGCAADLFGLTHWELMNYIGNTTISDYNITMSMSDRIKMVKEIFKIK